MAPMVMVPAVSGGSASKVTFAPRVTAFKVMALSTALNRPNKVTVLGAVAVKPLV